MVISGCSVGSSRLPLPSPCSSAAGMGGSAGRWPSGAPAMPRSFRGLPRRCRMLPAPARTWEPPVMRCSCTSLRSMSYVSSSSPSRSLPAGAGAGGVPHVAGGSPAAAAALQVRPSGGPAGGVRPTAASGRAVGRRPGRDCCAAAWRSTSLRPGAPLRTSLALPPQRLQLGEALPRPHQLVHAVKHLAAGAGRGRRLAAAQNGGRCTRDGRRLQGRRHCRHACRGARAAAAAPIAQAPGPTCFRLSSKRPDWKPGCRCSSAGIRLEQKRATSGPPWPSNTPNKWQSSLRWWAMCASSYGGGRRGRAAWRGWGGAGAGPQAIRAPAPARWQPRQAAAARQPLPCPPLPSLAVPGAPPPHLAFPPALHADHAIGAQPLVRPADALLVGVWGA